MDERPPIPFVPELEDPAWRPVYGSIEFNCPHWGVFENAIDMAHIHYLHSGTFGNQEQPEIRNMTCSTDAYGAYASFGLHNKPVNALWDFSKVGHDCILIVEQRKPDVSMMAIACAEAVRTCGT